LLDADVALVIQDLFCRGRWKPATVRATQKQRREKYAPSNENPDCVPSRIQSLYVIDEILRDCVADVDPLDGYTLPN